MKSFFRDTLITLLLALVIFFGARATFQHTIVIGSSMEPTLPPGEHLMINKVVYKFHEPARGDIVIFRSPSPHDQNQTPLIKRVIGLPGESVELKNGKVYIHKPDNSVLTLNELYIKDPARRDYYSQKIPENQYFVLGDNRNNSGDSREGWAVPRQNIIGKAWLAIWPPAEWGMAPNYPLPAN
ncbi:MAG: signal peptidase I [Chloroflexota bacterium]